MFHKLLSKDERFVGFVNKDSLILVYFDLNKVLSEVCLYKIIINRQYKIVRKLIKRLYHARTNDSTIISLCHSGMTNIEPLLDYISENYPDKRKFIEDII